MGMCLFAIAGLFAVSAAGQEEHCWECDLDFWEDIGPVLGLDLGSVSSHAALITRGKSSSTDSSIPVIVAAEGQGSHASASLQQMRAVAEAQFGHEVKHAVVTVPTYFSDTQRQAVKEAGIAAGLSVMRITDEPIAAATAYGLGRSHQYNKNILVLDFGGRTFDASLLYSGFNAVEVRSTTSDAHVSGRVIDERMIKYFVKKFTLAHGLVVSEDHKAMQKLRREVVYLKHKLSSQHQAPLEIESFFEGVDFTERLTRARFEALISDLLERALASISKVLRESGLEKSDVDELVVVGGSSRIPKVRQLIKDFFGGKEPFCQINPEEAIAYGAALEGDSVRGRPTMHGRALLDADGVARVAALDAATDWARVGLAEHAAIAAFARAALDLLRLGAPTDLVRATLAAADDEARHADAAFALAGGVAPGPLAFAPRPDAPTLASVAVAAIAEGGVTEPLGVRAAELALEGALPDAERAFHEMVARDEARHAALAWRTARWALERDPTLRPTLAAALEATLARHDPAARALPAVRDGAARLGLPLT